MKHLQFLPLKLALIALFAGSMIGWLAQTERQAAKSVQAEPVHLTCSELLVQPVFANRHLAVADYFAGENGVYSVSEESEVFSAYFPIYPEKTEADPSGGDIQLLAKFASLDNREQLTEAFKATELTGILDEDQRLPSDVLEHLQSHYPQLDPSKCRILVIGGRFPSIEQADTLQSMSYGAFCMGLCLLLPFASRFGARKLGISENPETADPYSDPPGGASLHQPDLKQQRIYSIAGAVLMTLSVATGVGCVAALQLGYAGIEVGFGGICASMLGATLGFWIMSSGETAFVEYSPQRVAVQDLPRSPRKYFDQQTPEFLSLGFEYLVDVRQPSKGITTRKLLAPDGRTLGELVTTNDVKSPGFVSITSDGVLHETTTAEVDVCEINETLSPWRVMSAKGGIAEVYAAHLDMVHFYANKRGLEILVIAPEEILAVGDYNHRVACWTRYQRGITSCRPPKLARFESIAELHAIREARLAAENSDRSQVGMGESLIAETRDMEPEFAGEMRGGQA